MARGRLPVANTERFMKYVKVDASGCWIWQGSRDKDGYGRWTMYRPELPVNARHLTGPAHRLGYEILVGAVPDGLVIDHLCRVRACVNPQHLEPVTTQENTKRSPLVGRHGLSKVACPQGHPYDEINTYWRRGRRHCRVCNRSAVARYKARVAKAAAA